MEAELTESSERNSKTEQIGGKLRGRCWWSLPNLSLKRTKYTSISENNKHWYWKDQAIKFIYF